LKDDEFSGGCFHPYGMLKKKGKARKGSSREKRRREAGLVGEEKENRSMQCIKEKKNDSGLERSQGLI